MLSRSFKILMFCCFFSPSLKLSGQEVINLVVNREAIRTNKTAIISGKVTMLILDQTNPPLSGMQLLLKNERTTGSNINILNGLYFKPKLGAVQNAYPIGSVKNLFRDNNAAAWAQDGGGNNRTAEFDFYLDASKISITMKPGTYTFVYDIEAVPPPSAKPGVTHYTLQTKTITFNITVEPYMLVYATARPVRINLSQLSLFKEGYKNPEIRQTYVVRQNQPFTVEVITEEDKFNYSMGSERNTNTEVKGVNAVITVEKNAPVRKTLAKSPGFLNVNEIDNGAGTTIDVDFEILPEKLQTDFFRAGKYQTNFRFFFRPIKGGVAGNPSVSGSSQPFEVVVNALSDLRVNRNTVDLVLQTANDYQNGVSTTLNDHLTFSSTSKYNLTVKAGSDKFVGVSDLKTSMPCGILSIGSVNQSGVLLNEIQLSTNPQNILTGDAAFEMNSGIRYMVKPNPELIKAKAGAYTIEVIYGITAQ